VSGARDLSRADLFGKSDPFVVLSWASTNLNAGKEKEIGLTSAIKQTLDPDWKDEDFLMQVYCQITPAQMLRALVPNLTPNFPLLHCHNLIINY
jgi:Ca2+-dependent lipid-binding protein